MFGMKGAISPSNNKKFGRPILLFYKVNNNIEERVIERKWPHVIP